MFTYFGGLGTAEKAASFSGFRVKVGMGLIWGLGFRVLGFRVLGFRVPMSRNPKPEYLL